MGYEDFERERNNRSGGNRFGGGRGFGRSSGRRDRRDMEMCDAVCAKCGKDCKVPFKPTGDKPVFCSECFEAQGNTRNPNISQEQFDKLNAKLDKIMKALEIIEETKNE